MLSSHKKAMVERMLLKTGIFLKWVPPKGEEGTTEKVLKICGLGAFQIQVLTRHENQRDGCWRTAAVGRTHPRGKPLASTCVGVWDFRGLIAQANSMMPLHPI